MTEVFADTFYWLSVLNPNDAHHAKALGLDLSSRRVVTSWAVQIEVMDALCERRKRPLAFRFWEESRMDRDLVIVPVDGGVMHRAAELYSSRSDKDWSMTDCTSFVIMRDRGISTALSGDRHFVQAGFKCAL